MSILQGCAAALFTAIALASGALHGMKTGLFVALPSLAPYAARLDGIPATFGDWQATDKKIEDDLGAAGIVGYQSRVYRHRRSGEQISTLVVCGRCGPISVHTPDVCYSGAGYSPVGDAALAPVPIEKREKPIPLWNLRFTPPKTRADGRELDIRWAWISSKGITAPTNPRVTFASEPVLFKVYIIQERLAVPNAQKVANPQLTEFLQQYLPALEKALVAPVTGA